MKALIAPLFFAALLSFAADNAPFEFKANDRIVFIGDALVERDIQYNYLETMLTIRLHGTGVTFRNVGWSGDTVWGESRGVFGTQKDGYNALVKIIGETKPTVAFLNYGRNESFAGPDGLARFEQQYTTLLDDLNKQAAGVRVVLLEPVGFQLDEMPPAARNEKLNENLKLYSTSIRKLAEKRAARFVSVYPAGSKMTRQKGAALTRDGMHLTAPGYLDYAFGVCVSLGLMTGNEMSIVTQWFPHLNDQGDRIGSDMLQENSVEHLRRMITEKNLQFFNRWRPQNETYLFLFRKKEQGQNAKEIPEFDPVIEAKEKEIAKLADELAKQMKL